MKSSLDFNKQNIEKIKEVLVENKSRTEILSKF